MTTFINFHPTTSDEIVRLETGCIIAGHHGQYATSNFIRWAMGLGFGLNLEDASALRAYESGDSDDPDTVVYLCDEAEEWVNARLEDGYVEWHEGELFLTKADVDTNS